MFLPSAQGYIDAMSAAPGSVWWTAAHSLKGVAAAAAAATFTS